MPGDTREGSAAISTAVRMPERVPGKVWTVEREPDWTTRDVDDVACSGQRGECTLPVIARRRDGRFSACSHHLAGGLMWIERGVVVSWRLRESGASPMSRSIPREEWDEV